MIRKPENVPSTGDHPDIGQIAAHAERRLTGAEAARMDEHLADCSTCHETFAETLRFALDEEAKGLVSDSMVEIVVVQECIHRRGIDEGRQSRYASTR